MIVMDMPKCKKPRPKRALRYCVDCIHFTEDTEGENLPLYAAKHNISVADAKWRINHGICKNPKRESCANTDMRYRRPCKLFEDKNGEVR